ncbi:hypothetical protein P9112_000809 [Eukaryota sp. TZLM1-RC]
MIFNTSTPTFEAVIFDLDGTLLDSMPLWKTIDGQFLSKRNIAVPKDLGDQIFGKSFRETAEYFINRFSLKETPEEVMSEWRTAASHLYDTCDLKPGALDVVKLLHSKGIPLGIGTSNDRVVLDRTLKRLGIDHYFTSTKTSGEVKKGKPNPHVFLAVASELQVEPSKCLVFEDTVVGTKAANAANAVSIGIYDEAAEKDKEEIMELTSGRYFFSWSQIRNYLFDLNKNDNSYFFSNDSFLRWLFYVCSTCLLLTITISFEN